MLRLIGIMLLVLVTIAALISEPLGDKNVEPEQEPSIEKEDEVDGPKQEAKSSIAHSDRSSLTIQETIKEDLFWKLFIMITFGISYPFFMKASFKNYGSLFFSSDSYLTLVATFVYASAALSRFIWGIVLDVIGFKKSFAMILLSVIFCCFTIQLTTGSEVLYIVWIIITNFCEGGHFALFPTLA